MYVNGLRGFINLLLVCVLTGSLSYAAVPLFNEYQAKANYLPDIPHKHFIFFKLKHLAEI